MGPLLRGQAHNHLRVWRGGSFNNNEDNLRCAYRNRNNPNNFNDNNGFRVAVAHVFPCAPELPGGALFSSGTRHEKWRGLSLAELRAMALKPGK